MAQTEMTRNVDLARRCLESGLTVMAQRYMNEARYEGRTRQ